MNNGITVLDVINTLEVHAGAFHGNLKGNVAGNLVDLSGNVAVKVNDKGSVELYFNGEKKLETSADGGHLIGQWDIDTPTMDANRLVYLGVTKATAVEAGLSVEEALIIKGDPSGTENFTIRALPSATAMLQFDGAKAYEAINVSNKGEVTFPSTPEIVRDDEENTFDLFQHYLQGITIDQDTNNKLVICLLYTSPSPRDA